MKQLKAALQNLAMEELDDGQVRVEREHVFYGRIADFEQLKSASECIKQEQWQVRVNKTDANLARGMIRSRKNLVDQDVEYVLTFKTFTDSEDRLEVTVEGSAGTHEIFKRLSDCGMIKHRYIFPVADSDVKFEVDVFMKPDGTYHHWCKIDLEVKDLSVPLPAFPITVVDVIKEGANLTPEQRNQVTELYDKYFLTKAADIGKVSSTDAQSGESSTAVKSV